MAHDVARIDIETLHSVRREARSGLRWEPVFVLPEWLEVWWRAFGRGAEQYVCRVSEDGEVIGIAPLMVRSGTASFIGAGDVCDYLDVVVVPGKERAVCSAVLDRLHDDGVGEFRLDSLRPDSVAYSHLADLARNRGHRVDCRLDDVSLDVGLPPTWEEYLDGLTPKQRREVGRKMRRLHEAGEVRFETVRDPDAVPDTMGILLQLLRDSRADKAAFMTAEMEVFFRAIAQRMATAGMLSLGVLSIGSLPVAAVMCFDYNDNVYLYNSGYDPTHSYLSVGLLSKVLSLRDSIEAGRKTYDFLKGAEEYKYRLGGREIPIYGCRIALD